MNIERKIEIATPAKDVWKVLGEEFLTWHEWMAGLANSTEMKDGSPIQNAPTVGRRSEIAINPGTFLDERISVFNPEEMSLTVSTTMVNVEGPVNGYSTEIKVKSVGDNKSEVIWSSNVSFGIMGYPLYFVIKKGLSGGFLRGLEELKCLVETGKPHERKLAAPHCG